MFGQVFGQLVFGGAYGNADVVAADPDGHVAVLPQSPDDLFQESALCHFVDLTTSDGSVTRVVDFGDPEASATAGYVDFDGETYQTVVLDLPRESESMDGGRQTATISIADPTNAIWRFCRDKANLKDATVRIRALYYHLIDSPELAIDKTFHVRSYSRSLRSAGPTISVQLGSPDVQSFRYPAARFNREGCQNSYANRFIHDGRNYCGYPSDNFAAQKKQVFTAGAATETERSHGWKILNSDVITAISTMKIGYPSGFDFDLQAATDPRWEDADRKGPYVFKDIPDDTDVDVFSECLVDYDPQVANDEAAFGLLIQSIADPTTWILWGVYWDSNATKKLLLRVTESDVSTDTFFSVPNEPVVRVKRTGSTWDFYSMGTESSAQETLEIAELQDLRTMMGTIRGTTTEVAPPSMAWTLRDTKTVSMSGTLRVGLTLCAFVTPFSHIARSEYVRFLAGGIRRCDLSKTDCERHGNLVRRNAYLGLPDAAARF